MLITVCSEEPHTPYIELPYMYVWTNNYGRTYIIYSAATLSMFSSKGVMLQDVSMILILAYQLDYGWTGGKYICLWLHHIHYIHTSLHTQNIIDICSFIMNSWTFSGSSCLITSAVNIRTYIPAILHNYYHFLHSTQSGSNSDITIHNYCGTSVQTIWTS